MKKWIFLGIIFIVFTVTGSVWANSVQLSDAVKLDEVIVTATRTEQAIDKVGGSSVTVITAEDIDTKKQIVVGEVLKGIPGIDVVGSGGPGTNTSIFMRGADSKNTLLLIDGVSFNDASHTTRSANFANLTTDFIERVEVVRGPMSALYGSNATAGVINIITKKGEGRPSIYAGVSGGSYNTWYYHGGVSGAIDKLNFSILGSSVQTDGFSIANDDNDDIPHAGNTSEDDGWKDNSIYGKIGFDINPDFDISANFLYIDARVDNDDWNWFAGYAGDRFDNDPITWLPVPAPNGPKKGKGENDQACGKFNVHNYFLNRQAESTLSFQGSRHKTAGFDNDGNEFYDFKGTAQEWSWQGGYTFRESNAINLGVNYSIEKMDSDSSNINNTDTVTKSIWIQDQVFLGDNFFLVAGLRVDDHENFGNKTTYRLAPAYHFNGTTIKASYGTGFRSPSLFELYSAFGNEGLGAEESYGWDIGIEHAIISGIMNAGITYFAMTFDDRIDWDPNRIIPGNPFPGGYNQFEGKTKTNGVEAFLKCQPNSDLNILINYTYTDTEDPDGKRLVRRPYNKISLNTKYRILRKGLVNIDVYWVGERDTITTAMDKNGNAVEKLDAYTLINLSLQYDINDHLNVYARVDNLFDKFYEEAWSYATPGASGYIGMKIKY